MKSGLPRANPRYVMSFILSWLIYHTNAKTRTITKTRKKRNMWEIANSRLRLYFVNLFSEPDLWHRILQ